jgi:NAD(P)-dependent dehydrogenase (short-subunit alcohol dehydrogenase family)
MGGWAVFPSALDCVSRGRHNSRMSGIAVITGTTHGIGMVTSRELARSGLTVVMLCRDLKATARVAAAIGALVPKADLHAVHCDLASLEAVRECAATVRRDFGGIDLLINNAGMVSTRHRRSVDGYELTFATNHLGPFLLTELLRDRMTAAGRIVNLASRAHYKGALDLAAIADPTARYHPQAAYARSKLANVMHTFALARRLSQSAARVSVNCLHPGVVRTNLLPPWLRLIKPLISPNIIDAERGALTTLYLASSKDVAGVSGRYYDEFQKEQQALAAAYDVGQQEALWEASERWTQSRVSNS